jgi:hypothetical protein
MAQPGASPPPNTGSPRYRRRPNFETWCAWPSIVGSLSATTRNSSRNSGSVIMRDEAGAGFTIMPPCASPPMGSWWLNGAVFPPRHAPVACTYPYPKYRPTSAHGDRPIRAERHNPWSIATLRQALARALLRQLPVVLFVSLTFYNTVVLGAFGTGSFQRTHRNSRSPILSFSQLT